MEEHYIWMRPAFERAWDPIWTAATRAERITLLKRACLAFAADPDVRSEVERFDDQAWGAALDAFEAESTLVMQSQAEPGGTWVDVALFRGFDAMSHAVGTGMADPMSVEAFRLYRPGGPRMWIATRPWRGRWVLHTTRNQ